MRKIKKIIVHCTATPEGRPVTVADVTAWHRERGWQTIGYHYLIGLSGEIWGGRNIEQMGAHTVGQNANSIGVCYVGGCDAKLQPKDTQTAAQTAALLRLVKDLKTKYSQATIHGHNEFAAKSCPSFDVKKWLKENGV